MQEILQLIAPLWALLSGIAVLGLGVILLSHRGPRPWGSVSFGLFALLWGVQISAVHLATLAQDLGTKSTLYLINLAALLPLPILLNEFALDQPGGRPRGARVVRALVALPLVAALVFLVFQPSLLYQGLGHIAEADLYYPQWTTLRFALVTVPLFAVLAYALYSLDRAERTARTDRARARFTMLVAGLGLYVAYNGANLVAYYLTDLALNGPSTSSALLVFASLPMALVALRVIARQRGLSADAPSAATAGRARFTWIALVLALLWGAFEGVAIYGPLPGLNSVGLWRLAAVTTIAYGIARWRMLDLPNKVRRLAGSSAGVSGAGATGVAAYATASFILTGLAGPLLLGLIAFGVTLVPGLKLARSLFSPAEPATRAEREEQVYGQRIEAYRAALEASLARGSLDEDAAFLAGLRDRFGITPDEDRILRHLARSAVLVPNDAGDLGGYDRLRLLGEGSFGRTWLARDRSRDTLVVLKVPLGHWQQDERVKERALREARLAARVRHPNAVRVIDVLQEADGRPIIVMEYADGGSLKEHLATKGVLPVGEAVQLVHAIAEGTAAIHAAGLVHRDLKPANILLSEEGPKIADFGIAAPTSTTGTVIDSDAERGGSEAYMAPEVAAGAQGDRRADVYGLGAVLHECLYGSPPGPNPVVSREDLPTDLEQLVQHALQEDPNARPPSARAIADALAQVSTS